MPSDINLIQSKTLRKLLGEVSHSTLWRWERDGIVPPPVVRLGGLKMWPRSVVAEVLEASNPKNR